MPDLDIEDWLFGCGFLFWVTMIALFVFLFRGGKKVEDNLRADERERDGSCCPLDETAVIPRIPADHPLHGLPPRTVSPSQRDEIDRLNSLFHGRIYGRPTKPEENR